MSHDGFRRLHVAIIMDGNGRWATGQGLPRVAGHRRGAVAVERIVEAAARLELGTLTLFALSADNWRRPESEISPVMAMSPRTGRRVSSEASAAAIVTPADGPSFGIAPDGTCRWISEFLKKSGSAP